MGPLEGIINDNINLREERDRERDRDRETETERQRDRERQRETDIRQRQTDRQESRQRELGHNHTHDLRLMYIIISSSRSDRVSTCNINTKLIEYILNHDIPSHPYTHSHINTIYNVHVHYTLSLYFTQLIQVSLMCVHNDHEAPTNYISHQLITQASRRDQTYLRTSYNHRQ